MWGTGPAPCPQGEPKWRVQRSGLIIPCAAAIHFLLNSLETAVPDLCPDFAVTEERSTHFPSRTFRDLNPVHAFNIEAGVRLELGCGNTTPKTRQSSCFVGAALLGLVASSALPGMSPQPCE